MAFLEGKLKRWRIPSICLEHPCSLCAPFMEVQGFSSLEVFDTESGYRSCSLFALPPADLCGPIQSLTLPVIMENDNTFH
jgi:hypothetical protein